MDRTKYKSIQLTLEDHEKITRAARAAGYNVRRGRGSQLAKFIVDSCIAAGKEPRTRKPSTK